MNINASNHSLDNVFIQQKTEKKRPSFTSVFEKLNKRVEKMNRKTPLNNVLTNEQLFRYYVKEVEPLLKKSNDDFGEGNISLGDIMRNLKSNMEVSGGTDGGNPPEEPPNEPDNTMNNGIINQVMEKTKGNNNRYSVLEDLEDDDVEAGTPLRDVKGMSQILENSYTYNAADDGEASFDPDFIEEPDGTRFVFGEDGNTFLKIEKSKNITGRQERDRTKSKFSTPDEELERLYGIRTLTGTPVRSSVFALGRSMNDSNSPAATRGRVKKPDNSENLFD